MKKVLLYLSIPAVFFAASSCKDDQTEPVVTTSSDSEVQITVQPVYGAEDLYLDSVYTTTEGYLVKFTDIKFYVHDVRNGGISMTDAGLFDYRDRGTLLLRATGDAGNFGSLQANLGVDASVNHDDPAAFPNSSMLNIANANDMHWGWNPGYIFVKIEGKADTIPDATELLDHNIVFHAGLDVNMQTLDFTNLQWITVTDKLSETQLQLDMAQFLQGATQSIDLKTEYTSHSAPGQETLTLKVMQNFKEALSPI